jgi:hypothetical protein
LKLILVIVSITFPQQASFSNFFQNNIYNKQLLVLSPKTTFKMPSFSTIMLSAFIAFNLSLPVLAQGNQFITGACTNDKDCAAGCCGFNTGKCAGPVVALGRDGGCGRGDPVSNNNAAVALGFANVAFTPVTAAGGAATAAPVVAAVAPVTAAIAPGSQFITGPCTTDKDCAAGCCGFNSGKCAGPVIAQERDGGCGRGDPTPNDTAAQKLKNGKRGARGWNL